jgi:hypothetical protein
VAIRPSFRGHGDGSVSVRLPGWLRGLLRGQFEEFAQVLDRDELDVVRDPLEEITGMRGGPVATPTDPILRRLRPDGYARDVDEGQAALDFRRFTEHDLAALQRQRVASLRETLSSTDKFELTPSQAQDWLGSLNDLRLAIGAVLDVTEEPLDVPDSEEESRAYEIYQVLGHLQHLLLVALGAPADY